MLTCQYHTSADYEQARLRPCHAKQLKGDSRGKFDSLLRDLHGLAIVFAHFAISAVKHIAPELKHFKGCLKRCLQDSLHGSPLESHCGTTLQILDIYEGSCSTHVISYDCAKQGITADLEDY